MSGGSKQKPTTTQQQSTTTQLPEWMTTAGQQLFNQAQAQKPVGAYQGPMTAGTSGNQQAASAAAAQGAGAWQGDLATSRAMTAAAASAAPGSVGADQVRANTMRAAQQGSTGYAAAGAAPTVQARDVGAQQAGAERQGVTNATAATAAPAMGYTAAGAGGGAPQVRADQVGGQTFDAAAAAQYANPYTQQVQANTLRTMQEQDAKDRASLQDGVQGARAFGGTRQALLESEQASDQAQRRQDYVDSSNAAAFAAAQGQFNTDRAANNALAVGNADRNLQASTTNASLWDQLMGRIDAASQFSAGAANANSEANAGRAQQTNLTNAGAANTAAGANADRSTQTSQFNAGQGNNVAVGNADRNLQAGTTSGDWLQQFFGRQDDASKFTAGAANDAAGANADRQQQAGQFNAGARNDVATGNADRNLDASKTNASLYEQMLGRLMGGGEQFGKLAEATSNLGSRDIANLAATGGVDQATEQAALDAAYQEYLRAGNAPLDNIKDIMAILSGAPRNVTTSGTSTGTSTQQQSGSLFNSLMGAAQIGAAAFSDRRLKTDIRWIDNLANGLGVYGYRYMWDARDADERIGVMADEVERIMPEALGPVVLGFRTVDYSKIGGLLA